MQLWDPYATLDSVVEDPRAPSSVIKDGAASRPSSRAGLPVQLGIG